MIPLKCPHLDWQSDPSKPDNEEVAALLTHYADTHGEDLPDTAREVIRACAKALGGARV